MNANNDALQTLREVETYLAEREDVIDGDYGQPAPNAEMTLLREVRAAIRALSADRGEAGYVDADELCVVQGHDDVPRLVAGGREIAAFIPGSWPQVGAAMYELGKACGHTPPSPAESAEGDAAELAESRRLSLLAFRDACDKIAKLAQRLRCHYTTRDAQVFGGLCEVTNVATEIYRLACAASALQHEPAAAPSQVSDSPIDRLLKRWEKIAATHGVRAFTGNDHLLFANELRAVLAQPQPGRVEGMEYEFEIFQDDSCQAGGTTFTLEAAVGEGSHYEMMYGQDGPVEVRYYEKRRIYPAAAPTAGGDA